MKTGKKITGGKYLKRRKKRLHERSGQKVPLRLGEEKRKVKKVRGGNVKVSLLRVKIVNVLSDGKTKKTEIKNVLETPSNRFLARQNIVTKGAVVETELGKVKITNRPTQEGIANGILVK
jgi:small subunit ribosomal protein S8e